MLRQFGKILLCMKKVFETACFLPSIAASQTFNPPGQIFCLPYKSNSGKCASGMPGKIQCSQVLRGRVAHFNWGTKSGLRCTGRIYAPGWFFQPRSRPPEHEWNQERRSRDTSLQGNCARSWPGMMNMAPAWQGAEFT